MSLRKLRSLIGDPEHETLRNVIKEELPDIDIKPEIPEIKTEFVENAVINTESISVKKEEMTCKTEKLDPSEMLEEISDTKDSIPSQTEILNDGPIKIEEGAGPVNIKSEPNSNEQKNVIEQITRGVNTETVNRAPVLLKRKFSRLHSHCRNFKPKRTKYHTPRRLAKAMSTLANSLIAAENINSPEVVTVRDNLEYCLTVTNLPNNLSFMDIKNYIDTQCGPVDEIEMLKNDQTGKGAIRLSYKTEEECKKAMKKLMDKEIRGTKLVVTMDVMISDVLNETEGQPDTDPPETPQPPTTQNSWRPDLDIWETDPEGLYGLKKSFLQTLNLTAPLDKWVRVSNFRCEKSDLRDVLEMAGNVIMCSVFTGTSKFATVMYSHPLEAVQAVSMLNGQTFYGLPLEVVMERCPANTVLLPKGLTGIGKGLGAYGKPIRSILKHYQRFVTNKDASVNCEAFENPQNLDEYPNKKTVQEEVHFVIQNVENFNNIESNDAASARKSPAVSINTPGTSAVVQPVLAKSTVQDIAVNSQVQIRKPVVQPPARSPLRLQFPDQTCKARIFASRFGQFGPRFNQDPRMVGPFGPGPHPGWNGQGPMVGPMPRQMSGPMSGPMHSPMSAPMHGPMSRPMHGPMPGSMPGPMHGPMPGQMPGPMPGAMSGSMPGPMSGPMPGPMSGPMPGTMPGPMPGQMSGQMPGTMSGPMPGPMSGPMPGPMPGQMSGPMPGPMSGPMSGPMPQMFAHENEPVQLQLSHLPPTATFGILCGKMAECGQVLSIQLTTPGCAVVTFANRMQADRCVQSYNNICIEGHTIQVKYN